MLLLRIARRRRALDRYQKRPRGCQRGWPRIKIFGVITSMGDFQQWTIIIIMMMMAPSHALNSCMMCYYTVLCVISAIRVHKEQKRGNRPLLQYRASVPCR